MTKWHMLLLAIFGTTLAIFVGGESPAQDALKGEGPAFSIDRIRADIKYLASEAARRGAKAVLIIHTNETAGCPFSVVQLSNRLRGMNTVPPVKTGS